MGIITEHSTSIWCYWKFSKVWDWGGREYLEAKYPDAKVYDVNGNELERTEYPPLRLVQ